MTEDQLNNVTLFSVLLLYSALDGWRDAWLGEAWLARHIIKWLAFYSLPVYLLWSRNQLKLSNAKTLVWLAAGGFFFWQLFYTVMQ